MPDRECTFCRFLQVVHIFTGNIKREDIKMTHFAFQGLRETWVTWETRATLARPGPLARRVSCIFLFSSGDFKQIEHTLDMLKRFCSIKMISFFSSKI